MLVSSSVCDAGGGEAGGRQGGVQVGCVVVASPRGEMAL